jgi:ABC-type multidrug transport system ATPase subunit
LIAADVAWPPSPLYPALTVPKNSQIITGEVIHNNVSSSVYVQQEDILFAQLTTYETLETSAILRASNHLSSSKKQSIVEKLILKLGLKKVSNTKVGDAKTRGVSGGEKKRISIGNELIC